MDVTKTNSVPEEQFDNLDKTIENAANVSEKTLEPNSTSEKPDDDEIIDFSGEEAAAAADSDEFDLENDGDVEAEENAFVSTNFGKMTKSELNEAFRRELDTKPIEQMRADVDAIKTAFYKILRQEQDALRKEYIAKGNNIETFVAPIDKDEIDFKAIFNSYKAKRNEYLRKLEGEKEDNYNKKLAIIEEIKELVDRKENINRTFQEFKELQKKWRDIGAIPQAYVKDTWDTYNHHVENFYDLLKINKDLRDMDFKKNLEAKTKLCEKAEELLIEPSIISAFKKLQKYHDQWREIGPVANELKEQIWERFKEATSKINKKHQEYFESQKGMQEQNLKAKTVLCEKAEELINADVSTNKEWNKLSKSLIELQKTWKTIGFAAKKDNAKIYERFRTACDAFFAKKREFYSDFKNKMEQNLQKKIELCEKAETLSDSKEWKKTTDTLVKLQKEWKEIGVVPRKVSNEVWTRFRAACDKFFNNRKESFKKQDSKYEQNLMDKEQIITEIKNFTLSTNAKENLNALNEFQRKWTGIGYVPIKEKNRVQNEYHNALEALFKALNISEKDRKIVKFKSRLEELHGNKGQEKTLRNERDKLMQQIRQTESDIAVLENNIGFFAKSENADNLIADINKKIDKAREEVLVIEEKIKLLDETI